MSATLLILGALLAVLFGVVGSIVQKHEQGYKSSSENEDENWKNESESFDIVQYFHDIAANLLSLPLLIALMIAAAPFFVWNNLNEWYHHQYDVIIDATLIPAPEDIPIHSHEWDDELPPWQTIHSDVFRPPRDARHIAIVATGHQLFACVSFLTLTAICGGVYNINGRTAIAVFVLTCAVSSLVGGYTSAQTYLEHSKHQRRRGDNEWKTVMAVTALLSSSIAFSIGVLSAINIALPFQSFLILLMIWASVTMICVFVGTMAGRRRFKEGQTMRTNNIPRMIPPLRWYLSPIVLYPACGVLPFVFTLIPIHYIFRAFFQQTYIVAFVYINIVLICAVATALIIGITIVTIYGLLNAENYQWHWASIFAGGSMAMYVYMYGVFFYFTAGQLAVGWFLYFSYVFWMSVCVFVCGGTVGYITASALVWKLYSTMRVDL